MPIQHVTHLLSKFASTVQGWLKIQGLLAATTAVVPWARTVSFEFCCKQILSWWSLAMQDYEALIPVTPDISPKLGWCMVEGNLSEGAVRF